MRVALRATARKGHGYGLHFGAREAKRIPKRTKELEVEMDGRFHVFRLKENFWSTSPELRGPAIEEWLRRHRLHTWRRGNPPEVELSPLGVNRYRLKRSTGGRSVLTSTGRLR